MRRTGGIVPSVKSQDNVSVPIEAQRTRQALRLQEILVRGEIPGLAWVEDPQ